VRILLVLPKPPPSFWTCSEASPITGCSSHMQNIALPTLAALTPPDFEVTIVDEAAQPLDFDGDWDLVGITGYITHARRMFEIADEFRRRGRPVAIGGPYASLSPGRVRPHADILFVGEAERTWPTFLEDFRAGRWRDEYRAESAIELKDSPVPAVEKLEARYMTGLVQTSRGCPFQCEFCDVIVYLGRKQRHKEPDKVVAELEQLYGEGYRYVFLADDNFTANRKKCVEILSAVRDWNQGKPEPVHFSTQLSIDIARETDAGVLDLCAEAGMREVFIGIETPDHDALKEVKKHQNVRVDLVADIGRIQSKGMAVWAGMISGFDADTRESFARQYEFVQRAGILVVALSLLVAPEGTPLEDRLRREGRLTDDVDDVFISTNIIPKSMTRDDLLVGARWLWNRLYAPEAFLARVGVMADRMPSRGERRQASRDSAQYWARLFDEYERMGPEFRTLPRRAIKLFRAKDTTVLGGALVFYCHVVKLLKRWDIWDPALALAEQPDFDGAAARTLRAAAVGANSAAG
jgi:radical SAM superfamily enzyme YgiQ (UPF0313 family)